MTGFLRRIWRRPLTVVGLLLLVAHVGIALFSPWLMPYGPSQLVGMPFEPPVPPSPSAPIFWAATI